MSDKWGKVLDGNPSVFSCIYMKQIENILHSWK